MLIFLDFHCIWLLILSCYLDNWLCIDFYLSIPYMASGWFHVVWCWWMVRPVVDMSCSMLTDLCLSGYRVYANLLALENFWCLAPGPTRLMLVIGLPSCTTCNVLNCGDAVSSRLAASSSVPTEALFGIFIWFNKFFLPFKFGDDLFLVNWGIIFVI